MEVVSCCAARGFAGVVLASGVAAPAPYRCARKVAYVKNFWSGTVPKHKGVKSLGDKPRHAEKAFEEQKAATNVVEDKLPALKGTFNAQAIMTRGDRRPAGRPRTTGLRAQHRSGGPRPETHNGGRGDPHRADARLHTQEHSQV